MVLFANENLEEILKSKCSHTTAFNNEALIVREINNGSSLFHGIFIAEFEGFRIVQDFVAATQRDLDSILEMEANSWHIMHGAG